MIRIAHISDSHFDERARLEDVVDVHRTFIDHCKDARVDLIVHSGDWFERRSTPLERIAVAEFLERAMHVAPVFGVKGNHDAELDLSIFPRLDQGGEGVVILERPTSTPDSSPLYPLPRKAGRTLGLLGLPWFDKAHLVSQLDATVDAKQTRQLTIDAAQQLLTCLRAEASRLRSQGVIPILAAHVLAAGSEVSTGQTLIGTTVELAPQDLLDVGAAYTALGHVHKTQEWFDGRVAYAGSPHRCNYGESEAKGWRLVTLDDDGEFLSNEFIVLPAREILLIECDWSTEDGAAKLRAAGVNPFCFALDHKKDVPGARVRFRYRIRAEDLHLAPRDVIEDVFLADGAVEVQVEPIIVSETRARAPEIATTTSTVDKLDAYLKSKGIDIPDAQRDRLVSKLGVLEGGIHAAN